VLGWPQGCVQTLRVCRDHIFHRIQGLVHELVSLLILFARDVLKFARGEPPDGGNRLIV